MLDIEIHVCPVGGSPLVRDYLAGAPAAAEFFSGSPFDAASYRRKWREVEGRFGPEERARAATALRPTSERARRRLHTFVEHGGAVVTTGQQTGVLTGPLYTLYKALSAAVLAERLEALLGVVVLPVFWCASEDHDWAEVNHVHVARGQEVHRLELPSDDPRHLPMSRRRLGREVIPFLNRVGQLLDPAIVDLSPLNVVRDAYRPGATVAGAFRELLEAWLAPFDLLTTDAADPQLKRLSAFALEQALATAGEQEAGVSRRTARLAAAGYAPQVAVMPEATNLFLVDEAGRERLYRGPAGFVAHESRRVFTAAELRARLAADPESLSPNVLLRPVVESLVFPSLAYVAGPGEMAYFAQIGPLFGEYGIGAPVVVPRASLLLAEPELAGSLASLDLTVDDLGLPAHELVTRLARQAMPERAERALEELRRSTVEGYERLIENEELRDPGLAGALGRLRNESLASINRSEAKILRHVKRRELDRIARLERARAHLRPNGAPQERVLNATQFLAAHGEGLLSRVHRRIAESSAPLLADTPSPAVRS